MWDPKANPHDTTLLDLIPFLQMVQEVHVDVSVIQEKLMCTAALALLPSCCMCVNVYCIFHSVSCHVKATHNRCCNASAGGCWNCLLLDAHVLQGIDT
jgi:hypothetical protein